MKRLILQNCHGEQLSEIALLSKPHVMLSKRHMTRKHLRTGATGAERGSVMTFKRVAAACVGAALSLAITSFGSGAFAADTTTTTTWKPAEPPPPPPPPPLDIHGFFDVTFANDYMTPRGLLVTNTGLTTQIVSGLTFSLYKDPNTWINSFSITAGTFNDL